MRDVPSNRPLEASRSQGLRREDVFEVDISALPVDCDNAPLFAVADMVVVVVGVLDVCQGFAGLAVVMEICKNFKEQNADVSEAFRDTPYVIPG